MNLLRRSLKEYKKIIDLTMPLKPDMRGVSFETAKTVEKDGWNARMLHLYSHAGTHMDAPIHFGVSEETIDTIPLEQCIGEAWVIDATMVKPKGLIHVEHLGDVATNFKPGESLLIHTGWSKVASDPDKYRNELPRISEELAQWCVANQVKMMGVEPPSVADVNNIEEVTRIHKILLSGGVVIIEGLCNLDQIDQAKVMLYALPLKVYQGDGAPARVFVAAD
ncbi:MAG: cyclase family protein [Calditrichaeota bacterium]|nr:MAG: cyclase family protein [Calditrichota bacterium]